MTTRPIVIHVPAHIHNRLQQDPSDATVQELALRCFTSGFQALSEAPVPPVVEAQTAAVDEPAPGETAIEAACRAIGFALAIDDHYELREFLAGWSEGDTAEWPEFAAGATKPEPEPEPPEPEPEPVPVEAAAITPARRKAVLGFASAGHKPPAIAKMTKLSVAQVKAVLGK